MKQFSLPILLAIMVVGVLTSSAFGEEADVEPAEEAAETDAAPAAAAIYIPLKPQFVVNYGGAGRLRYLKTGVTVRLSSGDAANAVRHHLPYIRNNLVMLFARQTDETLSSQEGQLAMQAEALADVRDLLAREENIPPEQIVDILFNSLTYH